MEKILKNGEKILEEASVYPESVWTELIAKSSSETVIKRCLQIEAHFNKVIKESNEQHKNLKPPETSVEPYQTALQVRRNQTQERVLELLLDIPQGNYRTWS
jgi:hypothetical protein